jgi:hypothetical protein
MAAEPVERRVGTEGNASQHHTRRAQNRESVTQALERVRQAARTRKKERFTALLHHVDTDLLRIAFFALQRDAAPGRGRADMAGLRGRPRGNSERQFSATGSSNDPGRFSRLTTPY